MSFYKKNTGRHSQEETAMIKAIEQIIEEKGIPLSEVPECYSLEDLIEAKLLLESLEADEVTQSIEHEVKSDHPIDQEIDSDMEIPSDELHDPEPPILEEMQDPGLNQRVDEFKPDYIAENYNPFEEPIIERSYNQQQNFGNAGPIDQDEEDLKLDEAPNPNLGDLGDHTKRRTAELTADTLLKGYAQIAPQPFKWLAKLPEQKIEKMAFDGELDLSIEVSEGVTFDDYMRQTNAQVDELFEVEEETLNDIREPLIEVLMEQNMVLTPAQRLTAAVLSHLGQMLAVALKLRHQNNRILSYQKHLTYLSKGARVAA